VPILETKSPGVFGFERTPSRAPEGLSPAKAAFVGWTDEGLSNTPVEVRSFEEFERVFGNISTMGLVPIMVHAFFATGGERCYIVRAVAADAVSAQVEIDPVPGPVKWTFISNGEGLWGNDTTIRIRGNKNFLDRTVGAEAWEKFDVLVLRPSDFDDNILEAKETFTAVQFTDPDAGDYVTLVMMDPRRPSTLVEIVEGAGGTPAGLLATTIADEVAVPGGSVNGIDTSFSGTLASGPVLDGSLTFVASDAAIDDEAQTAAPVPDDLATDFTLTLPTAPVLDGSLRLFAAAQPVANEVVTVAPVPDGIATAFTVAASALSDKVHREGAVFRLKYAALGSASGPNLLHTDGGGGLAHDLSTTPLTVALPAHPGSVSLSVDISGVPVAQLDDGAGNFPVTPELPAGATINYDTGALTGVTAPLFASSTITELHNTSSIITKAAGTDNLELGVALAGAVTAGTIDLVDSVATPTGNGAISFTVGTAIDGTVTGVYLDFVPLQIVDGDVAGTLTGDIGAGTNTADYTTGAVAVSWASAALTGETIDADYATGQIATDDGLGNLVGDVDPAGTNTIDYATGAYVLDWDSPPVAATDILANYANLAQFVDYPLVGGLDGSAVSRSDISAAALEPSKTGIYALDLVEEPLNVVVPDFEGSEFVQFDLVQFARARADSRYLIMGFANGTTVDEAVQYNLVTQAWDEKIGALYYPNIFYVNPVTDRVELVPVTGFAAGVYSKTANNKNIGKSPGGIEDGALDGVGTVGPEITLDLAQRDDLYSSRINPIINSQATGLAVWGVRGLSKEARWQWVNARQLHNFLMYSISLNLQWAVFENNGPPLWVRIETALKGYFGSLFRLGYFQGETEEQAFFVKCNATNNNEETVAQGKAIIDIGFTPNTPAEFIIFTLQQPVGQTTATV
jgi:hypothetical protein